MAQSVRPRLAIQTQISHFRALLAEHDGTVVGIHRQQLARFSPPFDHPEYLASLPRSRHRRLGRVRLLERLLRLEIYRMVRTPHGTEVATSREGILRRAEGCRQFEVVFADPRSRRPLSLCTDGVGRVYFGEYFNNAERDVVRVFVSEDDGRKWQECYRFPAGAIRHVHGLVYDQTRDAIWVMTGDYGNEAQVGLATPGFHEFTLIAHGSQQTRACDGIPLGRHLIYATDTPLEQNHVIMLNGDTGLSHTVASVQNSVLFMGRACGGMFLSTIVEPSKVNLTQSVHIWYSADGTDWTEVYSAPRDRWSTRYFQYPTASFALGPSDAPYVFISLRGTRAGDGDCWVGQIR